MWPNIHNHLISISVILVWRRASEVKVCQSPVFEWGHFRRALNAAAPRRDEELQQLHGDVIRPGAQRTRLQPPRAPRRHRTTLHCPSFPTRPRRTRRIISVLLLSREKWTREKLFSRRLKNKRARTGCFRVTDGINPERRRQVVVLRTGLRTHGPDFFSTVRLKLWFFFSFYLLISLDRL